MFGFCCLGLVCSVFVFTCSEWPEIYLNYLLFLKLCLLLFLFDFIILFLSLQFSNARIEDYKFSSDNCFVYILHDVVLSWTFTSKSIPYKFSFYFLLILRLFLNLKKKNYFDSFLYQSLIFLFFCSFFRKCGLYNFRILEFIEIFYLFYFRNNFCECSNYI